MIERPFAFLLLMTICLTQTVEVPRPISLTVAELGDSITLQCPVSRDGFFQWYKQSVGYLLQTIVKGSYEKINLLGGLNNSRFTITKEVSQYFLVITNVSKEDEATYLCQTGSVYEQSFVNGTFLTVNDYDLQKSVYVKQEAETKSVQLGDPVSLQCSLLSRNQKNRTPCPDKRRVSWFRSGKSHPGLVYTHWNSSADCVESHSSQRSCVYTLPKHMRSSSDAGTYYCAVATCGEILFGDGTRVDMKANGLWSVADSWKDNVILLVFSAYAAISVIVIAALTHAIKTKACGCCKELQTNAAAARGDQWSQQRDMRDYSAVVFAVKKTASRDVKAAERDHIYAAIRAFGLD
ncbi:uncharacterized protein LOC142999431 [Genypterus blacodes]|uniref:uncharacterized protein LOC142999431 n=1 Tax=Genypterus blacodes TaxID=154954 RepID=UPI003F76379F